MSWVRAAHALSGKKGNKVPATVILQSPLIDISSSFNATLFEISRGKLGMTFSVDLLKKA